MHTYYILHYLTEILRANDLFNSISVALLNYKNSFSEEKIDELAALCSTSNASITRYAKMFGYSNYRVFIGALCKMKEDFLNYSGLLKVKTNSDEESVKACQSLIDETMIQTFKRNDIAVFSKAVNLLTSAKRVFIIGSPIPQVISFLRMELRELGVESSCYSNPNDQLDSLLELSEEDVVLFFNCSSSETSLPKLRMHYENHDKLIIISTSTVRNRNNKPYSCFFSIPNNTLSINLITASIIVENFIAIIQNR